MGSYEKMVGRVWRTARVMVKIVDPTMREARKPFFIPVSNAVLKRQRVYL